MKEGRAILVEGYIDVIACHKAGVTNAVASLGTSLTDEQAKLMKRFCNDVTILYDSDKAGQKAAGKAIDILGNAGIRTKVALMPEGEDPDTLLRRDGPEAVRTAVERGITPIDFAMHTLEAATEKTDPDFWQQAVEILAGASTAQEIEKHITRLAGQHPDLRVPSAAERALRADVAKIRRARGTNTSASTQTLGLASTSQQNETPLHPWESAIFQSVLAPSLREEAWPIATDSSYMITGRAANLAEDLTISFTEPPKGESKLWLHLVTSDESQRLLTQLAFIADARAVNQANLQGAIARLTEKKEEKVTRAIKEQSGEKSAMELRAIHNRLKEKQRLKGVLPDEESDKLF